MQIEDFAIFVDGARAVCHLANGLIKVLLCTRGKKQLEIYIR